MKFPIVQSFNVAQHTSTTGISEVTTLQLEFRYLGATSAEEKFVRIPDRASSPVLEAAERRNIGMMLIGLGCGREEEYR
jgi:hypothetical protein